MKLLALLPWLALLLTGLSAPAARAQSFGPPLLGEVLYQIQDREGWTRFTLEVYVAQWQNLLPLTLRNRPPVPASVRLAQTNTDPSTRDIQLVITSPPSPLFEATYGLGRHWSLGLWYNPIRDEHVQKDLKIQGASYRLSLDRSTDLADAHLAYYASRGLSAQLGYYREGGTLHNINLPGQRRKDYGLVSWNIWITQRLDVRWRCQVLTPFLSVGYHPATSLHSASSVLTGVATTIGDRLSISVSVWQFNLAHPATRFTGGLVYRL
jgi:hypothetical protein